MPWLRVDDGLPFDAKVLTLGRNKTEINEAIGMMLRLWAWCAQTRTDGFVLASIVESIGSPACTKRLTRPAFGRAPFLHTRTSAQGCACLKGRPWPPEADYLVHDFLDRNPSREENDVSRAQKRELRDRELRQAVRERDRDMCRYCGIAVSWTDHKSPRGGVLDHVVPDVASGADNLVVACRGCNTRKGRRRPEAAGMRLLPLPRHPKSTTDPEPVTDGSTDRSRIGSESGHGSVLDPALDPTGHDPPPKPGPASANTQHLSPGAPLNQTRNHLTDRTNYTATDAPGRVGSGTGSTGPPTTQRTSASPNPYLRSAITGPSPDEHAGSTEEKT